MPLLPEDLRSVPFSRPPLGARGYDESQVDALVERVAAALAGAHDPGLVEELRNASFPRAGWGRRGYNQDEVHALLDLCIAVLSESDHPGAPAQASTGHSDDLVDAQPPAVESADSMRIRSAADLLARHLPPAGDEERGYHLKKADKILARMAAALQSTDPLTAAELEALRPPLTRRPGRGYQVDAFDGVLIGVASELRQRGR